VSTALTWTRSRPLGIFLAVGLAVAALARYGLDAAGVIAAFTCAVLVVLSIIDFESRRLPNRIVLPSAALVLAARLISAPEHWSAWLGASLGAALCFLVLVLVYPAGLGMGDVKLMLLLGALLGGAITSALMVGSLAGAAAALVLIARDGRSALRRRIAYGPFLAFGAVAVLLLLTP
jgi:leader peptidase (prepilin peptidase) / N-methyltransferase